MDNIAGTYASTGAYGPTVIYYICILHIYKYLYGIYCI